MEHFLEILIQRVHRQIYLNLFSVINLFTISRCGGALIYESCTFPQLDAILPIVIINVWKTSYQIQGNELAHTHRHTHTHFHYLSHSINNHTSITPNLIT